MPSSTGATSDTPADRPPAEVLLVGRDSESALTGPLTRSDGTPLLLTRAGDRPGVHQAMRRPERWSLILCDADAFYGLALARQLAERHHDLDASVVLLRAAGSSLSPAEALGRGAADLVHHGDREHLAAVIERELANADTRRRLRRLRLAGAADTGVLLMTRIADYGRPPAPAGDEPAPMPATAGIEDTQIKELIEGGGLTLAYQPILPLADRPGAPALFEVLLRLRDARGATLLPAQFFPAAERHRWLGRLDLWVFRRVLPLLAGLQADAADIGLFLNLSPATLDTPEVGGPLVETVSGAALKPGSLTIELTRAALAVESEGLARLCTALRSRHHGLLVERLQAGDEGLIQTHAEHLSHAKLDPDLVAAAAQDADARAGMQHLVRCAQNHGVRTIAAGLENGDLLPLLYDLGVDQVQGRFIARPGEQLLYPRTVVLPLAGQP